MAVISTDPVYSEPSPGATIDEGRWGRGDFVDPVFATDTQVGFTNTVSRWGRGDFMMPVSSLLPAPAGTRQYTYRGSMGGEYVYSTGSPPPGATDVIIVGGVKG
jgi:hypothetical protein